MRGSGKIQTFTTEEIEQYEEAWSQPGALTAMLNRYPARAWIIVKKASFFFSPTLPIGFSARRRRK
jgi:hypothetical protein